MKGDGADPVTSQLVCEMISRVLASHKDKHPLPALVLNQVSQQRRPLTGVDLNCALTDGGQLDRSTLDLEDGWLLEKTACKRLNRVWKRRGEEQVLPRLREEGQHSVQFRSEAKVEQSICLI